MATSDDVEVPAPQVPPGWEITRNSNGLFFNSPDDNPERAYRVQWWPAPHDGLYVEGYDYAVTVPRAVIDALLEERGLAVLSVREVSDGT